MVPAVPTSCTYPYNKIPTCIWSFKNKWRSGQKQCGTLSYPLVFLVVIPSPHSLCQLEWSASFSPQYTFLWCRCPNLWSHDPCPVWTGMDWKQSTCILATPNLHIYITYNLDMLISTFTNKFTGKINNVLYLHVTWVNVKIICLLSRGKKIICIFNIFGLR